MAVDPKVERERDAELQEHVEPRRDGGAREMGEQLAQRRLRAVERVVVHEGRRLRGERYSLAASFFTCRTPSLIHFGSDLRGSHCTGFDADARLPINLR